MTNKPCTPQLVSDPAQLVDGIKIGIPDSVTDSPVLAENLRKSVTSDFGLGTKIPEDFETGFDAMLRRDGRYPDNMEMLYQSFKKRLAREFNQQGATTA